MEATLRQADINEDLLCRVLTNIVVATRLYATTDASYMKCRDDPLKGARNKDSYIVSVDYNYVCIVRKSITHICDSIQQLGGCGDVTPSGIEAILNSLCLRYTPPASASYRLEKGRLVRVENAVTRQHRLALIEQYVFEENKTALVIHVGLLKHYLPSKLDNVDPFLGDIPHPLALAPIQQLNCIVCLKNERTLLIKPCHHVSLCFECVGLLKNNQCPVCNTGIKSFHRVYL